jgi:hypothetical protein
MRRLSTTLVVLCMASAAFAKDKPRVTVQVVDSETSERQSTYVVPGSDAKSTTTCDKSANETVYGKDNGRTVRAAVDTNSTSTCTTTARPATPSTTQVRSIRQENVEAVMADGTHVTLWCQQGFRQCVSLKAGFYSAEVDGNTVWMYIKDLSGKEHKIKYKAVSIDPDQAPPSSDQSGA